MKKAATKLRGQVRSQVQLGNEGAGKTKSKSDNFKRGEAINITAEEGKRIRAENPAPKITTFADFLFHHARVKTGSGYAPYHFTGREALLPIVERLDQILASGESDASLALCGGAQFGKTVLMLNLLAYLVAVQFRNVGYYLPDDDLVAGLVDGKLRPDVLDQIPWLARLIAVGKTLNASGRAVNRKGAFLCTDGKRTALAFMRGLGKIPTSFSMDVVVQDEKDDLPEEHARFLAGRMTASNLRLSLLIGTQRYHGAGQNLAFTEGTQHIGLVPCTGCGKKVNPETQWPGICRLVVEGSPSTEWPKLTVEGHFTYASKQAPLVAVAVPATGAEDSRNDEMGCENATLVPPAAGTAAATQHPAVIAFTHRQSYRLCCPDCGSLLDRDHPEWHAQAPEREPLRRWSYRLSQLLIPAVDLNQIVAAWQQAVRDPDHMTVFCTDRLALPKSTTQTLTPAVLEAARGDYALSPRSTALSLFSGNEVRYAGLDMGDQCWFVARAVDIQPPHDVRLLWIEPIAAERVRTRVPELFRQLGITALCVDAGPLRDLSRDLVFLLNGGSGSTPAHTSAFPPPFGGEPEFRVGVEPDPPGNLYWHEPTQRWRNVRAMCVEFTQREGHGLRQKYAQTQDGRAYPLLAANREAAQVIVPPSLNIGL